jgi:hypothetical protein
MPPTDPTNQPKWAGFTRRLAYYLFGIAIGLMVLGLFQVAKQRQAAVDEQRRKQLLSVPQPDDKLFPPVPRSEPAAPLPGAQTPAAAPTTK